MDNYSLNELNKIVSEQSRRIEDKSLQLRQKRAAREQLELEIQDLEAVLLEAADFYEKMEKLRQVEEDKIILTGLRRLGRRRRNERPRQGGYD